MIDIERLRQSRAAASNTAAVQSAVVTQSNVARESNPLSNGDPYQPGAVAPNPYAVPAQLPHRAPGIARMRIFFEKKKSWLSWLTRPIRILLISHGCGGCCFCWLSPSQSQPHGHQGSSRPPAMSARRLSGLAVKESAGDSSAQQTMEKGLSRNAQRQRTASGKQSAQRRKRSLHFWQG